AAAVVAIVEGRLPTAVRLDVDVEGRTEERARVQCDVGAEAREARAVAPFDERVDEHDARARPGGLGDQQQTIAEEAARGGAGVADDEPLEGRGGAVEVEAHLDALFDVEVLRIERGWLEGFGVELDGGAPAEA